VRDGEAYGCAVPTPILIRVWLPSYFLSSKIEQPSFKTALLVTFDVGNNVYLCSSGTLNAYMSFQSVTITYTNVLLFYVISFPALIDCLLIYCVVIIVFYCVAYSLFFFYNF